MSVTRFTSLAGFDKIIAGRDLAEVFENGAIYEAREICGEIVIKKVGMSCILDNKRAQCSTFRAYAWMRYPDGNVVTV